MVSQYKTQARELLNEVSGVDIREGSGKWKLGEYGRQIIFDTELEELKMFREVSQGRSS